MVIKGLFRKLFWLALLIGIAAFFGVSLFGVRVFRHQQADAARAAERFADLAFVRSDLDAAYALLAPELQRALPAAKLGEEIVKLHPTGRPTEARAIEYEPMPGQRAMLIYLNGTRGDETFHYRFVMAGDEPSGYRVGAFWRGSGPYPPSARRPL